MANAKKDSNRKPTIIGVNKNDAETPTNVAVNPLTGAIIVEISE